MKKLLLALFIFFAILSSNNINAYTTYSIVDLGNMGDRTTASAVNNHGVVVGSIRELNMGLSGAFKWQNGQTTILPFLSDMGATGATSINDKNEIVGFSTPFNWHAAVMWDSKGTINRLAGARATDINENSQIVSRSWLSFDSFLCEDDSCKVIASDELNGFMHSCPNAINDNGQVVGWGYIPGEDENPTIPYLWENGTLDNLNDLITDGYSGILGAAIDINNNSQIIGSSWLFENGNVLDLGFSGAAAINEIGQIVGSNFFYENGQLYNLDELIESEISYINLKANDINELGQIVGQFDVNGETHAFLMNPVPVPATILLLASGLIGVAGFRGNSGDTKIRGTPYLFTAILIMALVGARYLGYLFP